MVKDDGLKYDYITTITIVATLLIWYLEITWNTLQLLLLLEKLSLYLLRKYLCLFIVSYAKSLDHVLPYNPQVSLNGMYV